MSQRLQVRMAAIAVLAAAMGVMGGGAAQAATLDDPNVVFDSPVLTIEYGQPWYFAAVVENAAETWGPWTPSATMSNAPSGYVPFADGYQAGGIGYNAYAAGPPDTRPLPAGSYTVTISVQGSDAGAPVFSSPEPAQLTVTPAALGISLRALQDPSNPANGIISAAFTGAFLGTFFSTTDPNSPLTPAGTWEITATDPDGQVVHEFSLARTELDDSTGVSTYWSDVPAGEYTIRAVFTPSGSSSGSFSITQADPVTFSAAAAPGATSTATPAPSAPPAAETSGLTLPLWVPIAAGVVTAGLIALTVIQIVRLRRSGAPLEPEVAA